MLYDTAQLKLHLYMRDKANTSTIWILKTEATYSTTVYPAVLLPKALWAALL